MHTVEYSVVHTATCMPLLALRRLRGRKVRECATKIGRDAVAFLALRSGRVGYKR